MADPAPAKSIVLVHGAFADGSSWGEVVARLQAAGLAAVAVQNPLTSLADDVRATRRVLAMVEGPVVLVGHSYGGVVITEAGTDPKVSALVFVAALAPEPHEDFGTLAARFPGTPPPALDVGDGYAQLTQAAYLDDFAPDVAPERARVLAASQMPIEATLFTHRPTATAWRDRRCYYALSAADRLVDPGLQRFLAGRMDAHTAELDASHASPISQPGAIADLILLAARG